MPDIHHNIPAQLEHLRRREFTVFDIEYPFHGRRHNIEVAIQQNPQPQAPANKDPPHEEHLSDKAKMIQFHPINDHPSSSASGDESRHSTPVRPKVERIVDQRSTTLRASRSPSAEAESELRAEREYTVDLLVDCRVEASDEEYLTCWKSSIIEKRLIQYREDGSIFVDIEGEQWDIKECKALRADEPDTDCLAVWEETWQAVWTLKNAKDAIADFERRNNELDDEILSSIEEAAPANPDPRFHPQTAIPPLLRWKPEPNKDYRVGFRGLIQTTEGEDCPVLDLWPEEGDKRPLLIRERWIESRQHIDATRAEKKRAIFAQLSGVEQERPCERCHNKRGPFEQCVVTPNVANGACASCAYTKARNCNYHNQCKRFPFLFLPWI